MFDSDRSRYTEVERNARQLAESISRLIKDEKGHMSADAREKMDHVRQQAQDMYSRTQDTVKEKARAVDEYAHENVWKTVAMSAIAGVVLSALFNKKRK